MEYEVHRTWVSLALVRVGRRAYRGVMADERGIPLEGAALDRATGIERVTLLDGELEIALPDLVTPVRVAAAENPRRRIRDGSPGTAITVPVFVSSTVEDRDDLLLREVIPDVIANHLGQVGIQQGFVVVHHAPSGPLPPPVAPFRVLGIASELPYGAILDRTEHTTHDGLFHHRSAETAVEAFGILLGPSPVDVVIASTAEASMLEGTDDPARPVRLAILWADDDDGVRNPPSIARATVVVDLRAGFVDFGAASDRVLDGILDDLPLHDIVAGLHAEGMRARLHADPWSTHGLRLGDLYEGLVRTTTHLAGSFRPRIAPLVDPVDGRLRRFTLQAIERVQDLDVAFGLPGQHAAELVQASVAIADAQERLALAAEEDAGLDEPQDRVVNLSVHRTGGRPVDPRSRVYIGAGTRLARLGSYELDVQIGGPIAGSLVENPQTIDRILPDTRTWLELDVVLYSLDQAGPPVRDKLRLPPRGASEPRALALALPASGEEATYRITLLHEQNLIQTYRLSLAVGETEAELPSAVNRAVLEHSGTEWWSNLDQLRARDLSITLNDADGNHHIFVAGSEEQRSAALGSASITDTLETVRTLLERLHREEIGASEALLELAAVGRYQIYQAVAGDDPQLSADLLRIRDRPGTIQITRTEKNFVMPWAFAYDWPYEPTAEACFGGTPDDPCLHTSSSTGIVCARGFWGFRHVIENLWSPKGAAADRRNEVRTTGRAVGIDIGVPETDRPTATLNAIAEELWSGQVGWFPPTSDVNERIFRPDRPGVVLSIGHFDPSPTQGERIESATAARWLRERAIFDQYDKDQVRWADPASIVLLLGCGTGAVTPATATGFVATLTNVGAAACVVTECTVRTGLAAPMASHILGVLLGPTPISPPRQRTIGEAIREARQQLIMRSHDVRPLAFTLHGSADAHLQSA